MIDPRLYTASKPGKNVVWITGGGSGVGRCLALALSRQGHQVVISGRNLDRLEAVAAETGNATILPKVADVRNLEALNKVVSEVEQEIAPIDMAILNAGA
jgi:NADP-dependent 3-hydroxy acid dehydrogenase YdfG